MLVLLFSMLLGALMLAPAERRPACPPVELRDAHPSPELPSPRAKGRHCLSLRRRKP